MNLIVKRIWHDCCRKKVMDCVLCIYDSWDGDLKLCVVDFVFMICQMGIWSCVLCILWLWFVGSASNRISKQKNHITRLWPHSFLYNYVFSEKTVSGKPTALESRKKFFPEILGPWNSVWNLVQILGHWNFVWNFCFSERIQGSGCWWRREEKRREEGRNLKFGFCRRRRSKHEWGAAADHEQKLVSTNTTSSSWGGGSCSQRTTSSANKDSIGVMTMTFQFVC